MNIVCGALWFGASPGYPPQTLASFSIAIEAGFVHTLVLTDQLDGAIRLDGEIPIMGIEAARGAIPPSSPEDEAPAVSSGQYVDIV